MDSPVILFLFLASWFWSWLENVLDYDGKNLTSKTHQLSEAGRWERGQLENTMRCEEAKTSANTYTHAHRRTHTLSHTFYRSQIKVRNSGRRFISVLNVVCVYVRTRVSLFHPEPDTDGGCDRHLFLLFESPCEVNFSWWSLDIWNVKGRLCVRSAEERQQPCCR